MKRNKPKYTIQAINTKKLNRCLDNSTQINTTLVSFDVGSNICAYSFDIRVVIPDKGNEKVYTLITARYLKHDNVIGRFKTTKKYSDIITFIREFVTRKTGLEGFKLLHTSSYTSCQYSPTTHMNYINY